ncbi:MAG: hypothetical protein SFV51_25675 [Bryobacteraceae bacterium]|nr:hypothetical protein [Bryobacteraceae bacterium]
MHRRTFLLSASAAAAQTVSWQAGAVTHLLPTASENRILLKASFRQKQRAPVLRTGKQTVPGRPTDTQGYFWSFDAQGLAPGQPHTLELLDEGKRPLCDPWPVKTFPAPTDRPQRFRLMVYTCAGGDERLRGAGGASNFLPLALRQRLFDRALAFTPDAIIGNGDHIYWDLRQTGAPPQYPEDILASTGRFVRTQPVFGTANEDVLKRVCEQQIGRLYGTRFRSTPVFFLQDDHDYFENDDANARMVTYPPDHFMLQLGRGTRNLYFPEFLPDAERPPGLPGASAPDKPQGVGESFGTIRYGSLAEVALFDCRRYLSLAGPNAWIVPPEVEQWLGARAADTRVSHFVNLSSMPPVFSAGKWGDWYPDILGPDGKLTTKVEKPYYQQGWLKQHDRLMQTLSSMKGRVPIWISGDMHAHGEARLLRGAEADVRRNPVNVFLSGALGTGNGWPSRGRRTRPYPSQTIEVEERLPALEENGFLIVDFTPDAITVRFFRWLPERGADAIDRLEPFRTTELKRG